MVQITSPSLGRGWIRFSVNLALHHPLPNPPPKSKPDFGGGGCSVRKPGDSQAGSASPAPPLCAQRGEGEKHSAGLRSGGRLRKRPPSQCTTIQKPVRFPQNLTGLLFPINLAGRSAFRKGGYAVTYGLAVISSSPSRRGRSGEGGSPAAGLRSGGRRMVRSVCPKGRPHPTKTPSPGPL